MTSRQSEIFAGLGLQPRLEKDHNKAGHALKMYVKSAYLKPLVTKSNAQTWRFISLAGELSGAFEKKKKNKPKKKTP